MVVELEGGFKSLWLRFDVNCSAPHQLFYKEHSVRTHTADKPKGRTLLILNVPPWATSNSLKTSFANICAAARSAKFTADPDDSATSAKLPTCGFRKMYVVFQRESHLDKALTSLSRQDTITLHADEESSDSAVGLAKWCKEYSASVSMDESTIKKDIEEYMREYDERIANEKVNAHSGDEEEDEEGWVTVTGKKKRGKFAPARKESTIGKLRNKEEQKKHKKELLNFYTFQIREAKKQNLVELRKKFQLDKEKLQQMRSKRKFRPF